MEGHCRIPVAMDRRARLLSTLHSTLSMDEREPWLPRVQMVCVVLPAEVLGCRCPFNSSESIDNAHVGALISNPKACS